MHPFTYTYSQHNILNVSVPYVSVISNDTSKDMSLQAGYSFSIENFKSKNIFKTQ